MPATRVVHTSSVQVRMGVLTCCTLQIILWHIYNKIFSAILYIASASGSEGLLSFTLSWVHLSLLASRASYAGVTEGRIWLNTLARNCQSRRNEGRKRSTIIQLSRGSVYMTVFMRCVDKWLACKRDRRSHPESQAGPREWKPSPCPSSQWVSLQEPSPAEGEAVGMVRSSEGEDTGGSYTQGASIYISIYIYIPDLLGRRTLGRSDPAERADRYT